MKVRLTMMSIALSVPVSMSPIDCFILSPESTAFFATAMMANTKHSNMPSRAIAQYIFSTTVLPKNTSSSVFVSP